MKFGVLKSIAHNIADSLSSDIGLLIGYCATDIYGEAQRTANGVIVVDFLRGVAIEGEVSASLAEALTRYAEALRNLCSRQGGDVAAFKILAVRFDVDRVYGRRFTVTVEDCRGRRAVDAYSGMGGRRLKTRR